MSDDSTVDVPRCPKCDVDTVGEDVDPTRYRKCPDCGMKFTRLRDSFEESLPDTHRRARSPCPACGEPGIVRTARSYALAECPADPDDCPVDRYYEERPPTPDP